MREVMSARRDAVAPVLAAMSATRRAELVRSLRAFAAASGELGHGDVSSWAGRNRHTDGRDVRSRHRYQ